MSSEFLDYIFSPVAIRERSQKIYDLCLSGGGNFEIHEDKIEDVASFVLDVIREKYPTLEIPYHSRWGHFKAGDTGPASGSGSRLDLLRRKTSNLDSLERARIDFDLVITSVLLDAGAGPDWKYKEQSTGHEIGRSEGLGIASFYMFLEGAFSNRMGDAVGVGRFRADGERLSQINSELVAKYFQVSDSNPLVGLEGRSQLLKSLGEVVSSNEKIFVGGRPGGLVDYLHEKYGLNLEASNVLKAVLAGLGEIWSGRLSFEGVNLGDVWTHSGLGEGLDSYVPIHKLSQWLTYSLIEPLEEAGFTVSSLDGMTGLAEYRNGGLFVDLEVLTLRDFEKLAVAHEPSSELIIEWRALTIQLLDRVALVIREKLGKTSEEFPLAKVLEGGTWWAGRKIAKEKRADATPPIKIQSDGTVF